MTTTRNRQHVLGDLIAAHGLTNGAEIGVGTGPTTDALLTRFPDLQWLAIDYWPADYPLHYGGLIGQERQVEVRRKFEQKMAKFGPRLVLLDKPSLEAAEQIEDGALDLVFIDADHTYEGCLADIKAWSPKVRPGGFITGHDFHRGDFPGVVQAVEESFFSNYELHQDDVWLVRKVLPE